MKKNFILLILACGMLAVTQQVHAQREPLTSKTATKQKGYTILNKSEPITIYEYKHRAHAPKEAEKYGPKYFFTVSDSDILKPLTKENLKKAFPDNHPFHDALDATFKYDNELINYDEFHKMYKINWLLKQHS